MSNNSPSWDTLLRLMHKGPLDVLAASAANTPVHSGLQKGGPISGTVADSTDADVPVHSGLSVQITKPTTEDFSQMKELGEKAAAAQDEIADLLEPVNAQIKELRDKLMNEIAARVSELDNELDKNSNELLRKMLSHGVKTVRVSDRPPIEVTTSKTRSLTQKELVRILDKQEGMRVWNAITVTEKHAIKIPKPTPPEA